MTQNTRRRADTDRDIRHQARALLVSDGPQAVTLRAIARELGITAPALYRYYTSREDLLVHLRADICADLATELSADLADVPDTDLPARVTTVCRGFRRWALAHPQEFTLVFASPGTAPCAPDPLSREIAETSFGRVFLAVAGQVLATSGLADPPPVPTGLGADMAAFRADLLRMIAEAGVDLPESVLDEGVAYAVLRFWVRLYGQVALEVFGQFPFMVADPGAVFEAMLTDMVHEIGLR